MGNITCCICGKNSTHHVFKKQDTYQLMQGMKVDHYTGVSYCNECWDTMRDVLHQMIENKVQERQHEAATESTTPEGTV